MKILHTSDQHGKLRSRHLECEFDIWVDTGDFFPNKTRGDVHVEVPFQHNWIERKIRAIINALAGRPLVSVSGNHDYINLAQALINAGYENAHKINPTEIVEVSGLRFGGFPNINWIEGEWNYETPRGDIGRIVKNCPLDRIDILVTHAPPGSILDLYDGVSEGLAALSSALFYMPNSVKCHFFGHVHDCGGLTEEHHGIRFFNGATHRKVHEI